jgi:predicted anti-sigma-YlaC factor YlaD
MRSASDYPGMDCGTARTEISARLDGECPEPTARALDAHLATCPGCRAFAAEAAAVHRTVRLRAAEPVPNDLTAGVLAAIGDDDRPRDDGRVSSLRLGLAVIGVIQVLLALPALLLGDDANLPAHTARHLGSFAVALGIGFLVVAWQPRRVGGILPLTAVLVGCLLVSSALDVAAGDAGAWSELGGHATEVVGLGLLWLLARESGHSGARWVRLRHGGPAHS